MVWVHFRSDFNTTTTYRGFKASFKAGMHEHYLVISYVRTRSYKVFQLRVPVDIELCVPVLY